MKKTQWLSPRKGLLNYPYQASSVVHANQVVHNGYEIRSFTEQFLRYTYLFKEGELQIKDYIKKPKKKQWNYAEMSILTKSLINEYRESEYEERSPDDSPNITKKSVSTVGFRNNPENQNARPLALRSTQSFTGAIEELRFSNNFQRLNLCSRTNATQPKLTAGCPCGCHLRPAVVVPFRTRERNTLALNVVSPEVLHYHGYNFEPNQIAMFWKKDCRMFLWKKTKMQVGQSKT